MGDASQSNESNPATSGPRWWRRAHGIAWVLVSVAFLAFILLGTVPARIWRLGMLHVDTKSIAGTWAAQIRNLPDQFPGWIIQPLFVGSLIVFVVAVIVGFRLLLVPDPLEEG